MPRFYASGLREGNISTAEYVRHLFNDLILPTVANTAMMGLLKSGDIPDEPEEYVKDLGYYVLGGYPLARDAGSFIEYGMSPGFTNSLVNRGLSDPLMAGKRAYELVFKDQKRGDEWEKFLWSVETLSKWRRNKNGPPFSVKNRRIYYFKHDLWELGTIIIGSSFMGRRGAMAKTPFSKS